jgi:hypothetical protein
MAIPSKSINDPPSLNWMKLIEITLEVFECDFLIKSFNKNPEFFIHKNFKNKIPEIHKEEIAQPTSMHGLFFKG